jgi:hypothetical protein
MEKANNELEAIDEEVKKNKLVKDNMNYIKQEMAKEMNFDYNIDDFVNLLIEKVYVSKIDGDRNKIKLVVILKFGNPLEVNANKSKRGDFDFSITDSQCLLSVNDGVDRYEHAKRAHVSKNHWHIRRI